MTVFHAERDANPESLAIATALGHAWSPWTSCFEDDAGHAWYAGAKLVHDGVSVIEVRMLEKSDERTLFHGSLVGFVFEALDPNLFGIVATLIEALGIEARRCRTRMETIHELCPWVAKMIEDKT